MIDFLRWAAVLEIVGFAALPVTVWLLRYLPDRGYVFAKILGLLLVTYLAWLVGSLLPVAASPLLPLAALLVTGAVSWWFLRADCLASLRPVLSIVAVEEALFLVALIVWSLLRAYLFHPAISHTEQYMDLAFFNASLRSHAYPPYDPWMSGHVINYYYFGYLIFATLTRLCGVAPTVAYNLALSSLFALTLAGAYSLGYTLTRNRLWAALAPLFLALLGNWHAILVQIPHHQLPSNTHWWFWDATRVVNSPTDYTINEFPYFSFLLGDLHPHVMALPVTLLALAAAANLLLAPAAPLLQRTAPSVVRLALIAVILGSLFTINSWDFPTYLVIAAVCIAINGYVTDPSSTWWQAPLRYILVLAAASVLLFVPFYLRFQSLTHGLGIVTTPSNLGQFLQVFGFFLLLAALLVGSLGLLLQPAEEESGLAKLPGSAALGLAAKTSLDPVSLALMCLAAGIVIFGAVLHSWALLFILVTGAGAVLVLERVLNTEAPDRSDALALVLAGVACLVLALTETIYIRDSFDGSTSYRMNTVFKFYYQAWVLLALAGAYAVPRASGIFRRLYSPAAGGLALGLVLVGTLGGLVFTVGAPQSPLSSDATRSLDGMAWLQQDDPGQYAAIQWLDRVSGNPVTLEAVGADYNPDTSRISTFTGLPTVLGWPDHEGQWRGADPQIARRTADVRTIYMTGDLALARGLLQKYHVRFVVAGDAERVAYPGADLSKFGRLMTVAFSSGGTTVYRW